MSIFLNRVVFSIEIHRLLVTSDSRLSPGTKKNCQGQLQTPQLVPVAITRRIEEVPCSHLGPSTDYPYVFSDFTHTKVKVSP